MFFPPSAGDFAKFGLPMASGVTLLAWGMIEYREAYNAAGELANGLDCIKWPLDYFLKAHVADNKFYGQVYTTACVVCCYCHVQLNSLKLDEEYCFV